MTIVQTSASVESSNSLAIHLFIGNCKAIASEGRLPCCFKARTQHSQKRKRDNQQGRQIMSEQDLSGDVITSIVRCDCRGPAMGEWLIGDVSVLGVHV